MAGSQRVAIALPIKTGPVERTPMTARAAAVWFLHDMAQASGYALAEARRSTVVVSYYAVVRPMLTAPDPWYFAGIIALEACKVPDLFPPEISGEVMREIAAQADQVVARVGDDVATLAFLIMGRLGIGTVILRGKAPDSLLGKIMMILIGSPKTAAPHMPAPDAHKQLRAALKSGAPVWWKMFARRHKITVGTEAEPTLERKAG